ncbi:MAG TPA: STAS domain-containing protein [Actinomycetota bacterium]|nr:STAS domain-containing protein [Actinomycetota bacterium]
MIEPADVRFDVVDGTTVAHLSGEIDLSNAALIRRSLAEFVSNTELKLVVDLCEASFLDSAAIRVLFDLSRRLAEHKQQLIVVVPTESLIRRSLEVSGLASTVLMVATLEEAAAQR